MKTRYALAALVVLALTALAFPALARQVRINLSGFSFSPSSVTMNQGDHAVWVWLGSPPPVNSRHGDPSPPNPDGHFTTPTLSTGTTFSWRSNFTGSQPYYCVVHALSGMIGTLTLVGSGTTVGLSDFRITEVLFNDPANHDLIEISNLGDAGDLGMYRLKINGVSTQTLKLAVGFSINVPAGGSVVLHLNASGTSTATDVFLPAVAGLPLTGSVGLYVPNTVNTLLTNADQMIDFLQWGAAGQENEPTAGTAALWTSGEFVPNTVAVGHSSEFCGQGGQHGASHWAEIGTPTFGSIGSCTTPTVRTTWGRIKSLYH